MVQKRSYHQNLFVVMIISVVLWIAFIVFFSNFWPGSYEPGDPMGLFWAWFVIGTILFAGVTYLIFHLLNIPKSGQPAAVIAFLAPAFVLDLFATMFFETWFLNAGSADDRVYPAMILGGSGFLLLMVLVTSAPKNKS
ncbi:MAG: DUF5367 family protein [Chloroflexota bacterium]